MRLRNGVDMNKNEIHVPSAARSVRGETERSANMDAERTEKGFALGTPRVAVLRSNDPHRTDDGWLREANDVDIIPAAAAESLKKNERKINGTVLMNNVIKRYSLSFAIRNFLGQNEKITFVYVG